MDKIMTGEDLHTGHGNLKPWAGHRQVQEFISSRLCHHSIKHSDNDDSGKRYPMKGDIIQYVYTIRHRSPLQGCTHEMIQMIKKKMGILPR